MFSRALTRLSCKKEIPTRHVYIINLRGALNERVRVMFVMAAQRRDPSVRAIYSKTCLVKKGRERGK